MPNIIFLKNHGVIIGSEQINHVLSLYDRLTIIISDYLQVNITQYTDISNIMDIYNRICVCDKVAHLSEDYEINDILKTNFDLVLTKAAFPDQYVFNGIVPCIIDVINELSKVLIEYRSKYNEWPKVIIIERSRIYFIADTIKRARDMEDIFKSHVLALRYATSAVDTLTPAEFKYLATFAAEKYRQKL